MKFREYALPFDTNYVSLDEVPEGTKQILDVYEEITNHSDEWGAGRINELLDEFTDQQCYIAEDDESTDDDFELMAVANYRTEIRKGYAWIEGVAVHPDHRGRGVGNFVINNLIEIARQSGLREIRLASVQSAIDFYRRNDFVVMGETETRERTVMSREI